MKKRLVVFPGSSCPDHEKYASVYRLLEKAAIDYGYSSSDISLRWPGHNFLGTLTLDGAVKTAWEKIEKLEAGNADYDVVARSFGCYVALKLAKEKQPKRLRKIILWGPPPYWLAWELFYRDIKDISEKCKPYLTAVDATFFPSIEPIESMLPTMTYEMVVATGANDPLVPKSYLDYLESIVRIRNNGNNCQSIKFKAAVPGAAHEIKEDADESVKEAYLKALFE